MSTVSPLNHEAILFQSDFETYVAKVDIVKSAEIIRGKIAVSTSEEKYNDINGFRFVEKLKKKN